MRKPKLKTNHRKLKPKATKPGKRTAAKPKRR